MSKYQDIIEATLKVCKEESINRCTLKRVADEAGCSDSLIVKHFGSKKALMKATYEHVFDGLMNVLCRPEHEWSKGKVSENIEYAWRAMVRYLLDHPSDAVFYYECRSSEYVDVVLQVETEYISRYSKDYAMFESSMTSRISSPLKKSMFFILMDDCTGVYVKHMISGHLEQSMENIDLVWDLLRPSIEYAITGKVVTRPELETSEQNGLASVVE